MSDEPQLTDDTYRGTQILWGRVVVLLLALALAFWLGTTFGGDASAQSRIEDQRSEIARLESQVAALEAEVAAVDAGSGDGGREEEERDASPSQPARDTGRDSGDEGSGDDEGSDDDEGSGDDATEDGGATPANAEEDASEYVVQSGDSLAAIAQEVYGDPTLWREIARANDLEEPYALTVGETLEIPARP